MAFVIIDTSSILFGIACKKDAFEAAKQRFPKSNAMISIGVIRELRGISENRGARGASARAALETIRHKNVDVDNNSDNVDDWILGKSLEYPDSVVITNDTALIKRLKAEGVLALKLTKAGVLK